MSGTTKPCPLRLPSSCRILPRPWSSDLCTSRGPSIQNLLSCPWRSTYLQIKEGSSHFTLHTLSVAVLSCQYLSQVHIFNVFFFFSFEPKSPSAAQALPLCSPGLTALEFCTTEAPGGADFKPGNGFGLQLHFSDEENSVWMHLVIQTETTFIY